MGVILSFDVGARDGLLGRLVDERRAYLEWYERYQADYPDDAEPGVLELLRRFVSTGPDVLVPNSAVAAAVVDRLVDDFVLMYLDGSPAMSGRRDHWGILYASHYQGDREWIAALAPARALRLWDLLLRGRPVGRPEAQYPYVPVDIYRISYWTAEECADLLMDLEHTFGPDGRRLPPPTPRSLWQRYRRYRKGLFEPDGTGIRCAVRVLEDVVTGETGLITSIA